MRRVAVIGGGAAGMMAAVTAAGNGAAVTLYEKNDRVGKKILATGNGKCNFSNRDFSVGYYYGNGRKGVDCHRMERLFRQFSMEDTVNFFEEAGMLVKEKDGYLYPWSGQASTVLDILRMELDRLKVDIRVSAEIREIAVKGKRGEGRAGKGNSAIGGKFVLMPFGNDGSYHAVIIACGGCAAAKTGSDGDGYGLAKRLGHRIVPTVPALVQLRCSDVFFKAVAGVRCEAKIVLYAKAEDEEKRRKGAEKREGVSSIGAGKGEWAGSIGAGEREMGGAADGKAGRDVWIQEETGELQFTDYGISGIPVFQLSRQAAYLLREKKQVTATIDFFPHMGGWEFEEMCRQRLQHGRGETVGDFLLGMANKKVNLLMIKLAGLKPEEKVAAVGQKRLRRLLYSYRGLQVHVSAANSFEQAQVTAGGVDMAEVSDSLSSAKVPGVYFAGEILDVDGRCGGYNLQWAWTSGYIAGKGAASEGVDHLRRQM